MKQSKVISTLLTACIFISLGTVTSCTQEQEEKAKYIFLFIGDGMGMTQVNATESYLSYKEGKLGGERLTMSQFPYFGTATTYSANHYVTDSSAGGTAIACGVKTNNTYLGVDSEGQPAKSMAYELKEEGYQVGIVTTVTVNHATPGAFYANSASRYNYYDISKMIPETGFEFFAGSGFYQFYGIDGKSEAIDVYLENHGYPVAYGVEEFKKEAEGRKKMIFCQESNRDTSAGNYESSGKIAEDITLGQMLELGLEFLDTDEPFFFMCEGGKIDWTAHDNKVMPLVMDVLELDNAVAVAYEFYRQHPDETLIVVTADHETGGMSLGAGSEHVNWQAAEEQWNNDGKTNTLSKEDNKALNQKISIGWTTHGHTGTAVPVFAVGKGAEKFCGRMDNTDIKGKILCE